VKNLLRRLGEGIWFLFSAIFNIPIRLKYVIILCALLTGGAYLLTSSKLIKNVGGKEDYNEAMRYIEIKDLVTENYIGETDRKSMGDSAARSMVSGLGDKWSSYMSADEYKSFQLYSTSEYADIGMALQKEPSGGFYVMSVNLDSVAARAGLSGGMIITAVDGEDVTEKSVDEMRTLIRSKLNTKFTLTVNKEDIEVDCSPYYVSPVSYRLEKTEAGYVKIDNFEAGSSADAIAAIEDLLHQNAVALVIDLRGNPGGLLGEVQAFLDYLLPRGELFIAVNKDGKEEVTESDSICVQMPMCVLINGETYSAAEICAAVLQEYQWATIIGEATKGQTREQETIELSDGSAIRLSTRSYLTPNRVDISAKGGVVPDWIIHNPDESATGTTGGTTEGESGTASTSNDLQLMEALKMLS